MDTGKALLISREINKLRNRLSREVERQLIGPRQSNDSRIQVYFQRAFIRWIFNVIKKGKNPFVDRLAAVDFVSEYDLDYFFEKYPSLPRSNLDWKWLDEYFDRVQSIPNSVSDQNVEMFFTGTSVVLSYGGRIQTITRKQYENAKRRHLAGDQKLLASRLILLAARYEACGSTHNHCAVPSQVIKYANVKTELFGSPFNTCLDQYCSPFDDIEVHFGSLGSFFDFEMGTGIYLMNPPYDEELIQEAMTIVISRLRTKCEITVIVVIPVWDAESQESHKGKVFSTKKFQALETAESSGYVKSQCLLNYTKHRFYDYYQDKLVAVADTHLLIMSNTRCNLTAHELATEWASIN